MSSTVKNLTDLIVKIINDDLSWENLKAPYDPKDKKTSCQELLKDSVNLLQGTEKSLRVTFPKEYKDNAVEFIKIADALHNRSNPIYSQTAILNDNSPAQSRKEVKQKSPSFEKKDPTLEVIEQLKAAQRKAEKLNRRLTMLIQEDEETINSPTPLDNKNSLLRQRSMTDIKRHAINPDDPQTLRKLSSLSKTKSPESEGARPSFSSKKFETSNKSNPVEDYDQEPSNPELTPQTPQRERSTTAPSYPPKQVIDELTQRFQSKGNRSGSNKTAPDEQKH